MSIKQWTIIGTIVTAVSLVSMWAIPKIWDNTQLPTVTMKGNNNQNMQNVRIGNNSPMAQVSGNGQVTQVVNNSQVNFYAINHPDVKKVEELEEEVKKLKAHQLPFPDRPKVVVASPSVTFVNYTEDKAKGLVKARLQISFVNIGGVNAKDIKTQWKINDNGHSITDLDKWLESQGEKSFVITELPAKVNNALTVSYNPDISSSGVGRLELILDYEYANSQTGERYSEEYKGFVEYKTDKNNKPKFYSMTSLK